MVTQAIPDARRMWSEPGTSADVVHAGVPTV